MKFLCVRCDEPMKLGRTEGPDRGSLTAIFRCGKCGQETALLTNPWETQLVRSLDVKVGAGGGAPTGPFSMVRSSLVGASEAPAAGEAEATPKCPFTPVANEAFEKAGEGASAEKSGELRWTPGAEERIQRVPFFVRRMARSGVEQYARSKGYAEIDEKVLDEARAQFGM